MTLPDHDGFQRDEDSSLKARFVDISNFQEAGILVPQTSVHLAVAVKGGSSGLRWPIVGIMKQGRSTTLVAPPRTACIASS